jgi:hypothetical protein
LGLLLSLDNKEDQALIEKVRAAGQEYFRLSKGAYAFHITLAYNFLPIWPSHRRPIEEETQQLLEMIKAQLLLDNHVALKKPAVCSFDDMTKFVPLSLSEAPDEG